MVGLYRFVTGYVRVSASGDNPERVLNFCAKNSLSVWSIERKINCIDLSMGMSDYLKMRTYRKKIGMDIKFKLTEKHGLPMLKKMMVKRMGVCAGIVVFLVINILMSQFIWQIDVSGNSKLKESDIILACEEFGITTGIHREGIDTYDAAQKLALAFENIAWVSFNIEGSKLTVNISEATDSDEAEAIPRNIIASYDGVVKRMEVTAGTKNVVVNQAVRKGDLLVSGVVDNGDKTHFVCADGLVSAQTRRSFIETIDKTFTSKNNKGDFETRRVFEFFGIKIPLYLQGVDNKADTFFTRNRVIMFGGELPIAVSTRAFILTENSDVEISSEQAVNIALNNIAKKIRALPIDRVFNYDVSVKESESSFVVTIETICDENICEYQAISTVG